MCCDKVGEAGPEWLNWYSVVFFHSILESEMELLFIHDKKWLVVRRYTGIGRRQNREAEGEHNHSCAYSLVLSVGK